MPKITIELEIEGDAVDAYHVVNEILDIGMLQDAINEHEADAGPLRVTSATVHSSTTHARRVSTCGRCGNTYPCDEKGNGDCVACYDP